jgi:hypothetical protein
LAAEDIFGPEAGGMNERWCANSHLKLQRTEMAFWQVSYQDTTTLRYELISCISMGFHFL